MSWITDLAQLYYMQQAASSQNDKPKYSISPQQDWLFNKLKDLMGYSPTRDYVSSYADSYIKAQNAPNGALNWKPTFQSDYMKNQQPLPNFGMDLSKLPIMQGDKNGAMPWNANYSGPGIGGKPTVPANGNASPLASGARTMRGPMNRDTGGEWERFNAMTGGLSDYDRITGGYDGLPGQGGRNEFGMLVTNMSNASPQAQQQWNQWFGGLTPEQRHAELERSNALNNALMGMGQSVWNAVKGDKNFWTSVAAAPFTGGASLGTYLADKGLHAVWEKVKGMWSGNSGTPQGNTGVPNGSPPGGTIPGGGPY